MSTYRFIRRAVVLSAAVTVTGVATAGIASAHVTANVYGDAPEKGGYGAVVLRVPNEEEQVGTTKLEVTFDQKWEISSARTKPVPGWNAEVTKNGDVVERITWTARPGNEIAAGTSSYEEFEFVLGTLPENVDTLVLPAAQTYSDGTVVNWDEPPADNGEEPEHPAPVVELADASGGHHGGAGEPGTDEAADADAAAQSADATDDTARWLAGAGLAVGALGLGVGAGATIRARKKTTDA